MSINPLQSYQSTSALGDASVIDFTQQTVEQLSAHQFQHYADDDDDRNHASPTNDVAVFQRYSPPSFYPIVLQSLPHSKTYYNLLQQRDFQDTYIGLRGFIW